MSKFHRLKLHATNPSKILSSQVLRISWGPELSELSELSVPGCLAAWLPNGSMAPGRLGPREAKNGPTGPSGSHDVAPRSGPREARNGPAEGSGGSKLRRLETHWTAAPELFGEGGARIFRTPPL